MCYMKRGDLVLFPPRCFLLNDGGDKRKIGIWLSKRFSKWSTEHPFHTILVPGGVIEILIQDEEIEVISEGR